MNILTTLQSYMVYPFVRYALIAGVLIALCSSLLGVTLVLKRFSYIGDGLSHVAFGAMAVATVVSVSNNMVIVMPVTIISAILLLSQNSATNIRGDAALAMISVGALAFGYLVLNVFSKSANLSGDVCSTLFGSTSILTLKAVDVWICVLMSIVVVGLFTFFYHKLFAITFDADFARATGVPAGAYDVLIAVVTAVVIDRFPFRYLADDYSLTYYAAFVGCSAETEASFETIAFLAKKMDELKLPVVLTIEGDIHAIAETVVANTQAKDQKIMTMNSIQSVTANDMENGVTYLGIMTDNLDVLRAALQ